MTAANPFGAYFSQADAGPEDVVCCYLQRLFVQDDKLLEIFGADRIEYAPTLDAPDFRTPPRLQVGYDAAAEETQAPTKVDGREVRVIIRIRHDWHTWEPVLSGALQGDTWPWAYPSLSALENHILTLVKSARKLAATVNGDSIQLAKDGPFVGPFATSGMSEEQPGGAWAMLRDCRVSYGVQLDHDTGKIYNVHASGG